MLLGLIRPTSGSAQLFGRDPLVDGVRALDGVAGFVEGPRFYPYLSGRRNLRAARRLRRRRRALADRRRCSSSSSCATGRRTASAATRTACASVSESPRRSSASRDCSCSTSRPPGSTRPVCATCAISSAVSPARGSRSCSRATCSYEVEELCNRVAIIRKGSIVYEGALKRTPGDRRDRLPTACDRPGAGAGRSALPSPAVDGVALGDGRASLHRPTRTRSRALAIALGQARIGITALVAGDGEPRGALPRADGRRIVRPRPRGSRRVTAAVAQVYRWEIAKLLAQKRTYLGLGAAMLVPLIFVVVLVLQTGGPNDVPLGRYIRDTGPRDAVRRPLLHVDLGPAADHGARRRRHRRRRRASNGTLKTILTRSREPRRGLRRQGARDAHLHARRSSSRWASSALVAGSIAWGFHPLTSLSGTKVSAAHGVAPARREPRDLRAAARRDRRLRRAALDGHAQQRRLGRRRR